LESGITIWKYWLRRLETTIGEAEENLKINGLKVTEIKNRLPVVVEVKKNYTGRDYCEEKGIEIYYNSRYHRFSSSGLRNQVKQAESK
jgi:hypothetical protein